MQHDESADPKEAPSGPRDEAKRYAERLWRIRHSTAHIMATAIQEMFGDEAKFAIGPPIKDGFYYDFDLPRALSLDDLEEIERRMKAIVKANQTFDREHWSKEKARAFFADQPYKLKLIDRIEDEEVSIYVNGPFTDLCAGPHVARTKQCKHFKLLNVAGAYWAGDEHNPMLQRIYGTAWAKRDELDSHLRMLAEAKERDHRKLARELELFDWHPYSPGSLFWRPKGWLIYRTLQNYFRELGEAHGYEEIHNPILYKKELFETSGHWEHYREDMFQFHVGGTHGPGHGQDHSEESVKAKQIFCLKPMNCPDTMLYFASKKRSYRELPLRVAEFGTLHRNELQGALSGATRVRQFRQDDAHIFISEEQVGSEIALMLELVDQTYKLFGLDYTFEFSTRPDDFMGDVETWNEAERELKEVLDASGKPYTINEGDGAFYGPKIDIQILDALGRSWQCATIQLDFQLPKNFELTYTDAQNVERQPIVVHRAIAGSLERFLAILIEHFKGAFPTWMAPVQLKLVTVNDTDELMDYAWDIVRALKRAGVRAEVDERGLSLGRKKRDALVQKIPYIGIIGEREVADGTINITTYQDQRRKDSMTVEQIRDELLGKIAARTLDVDIEISELAKNDSGEAEPEEQAY
ncbi:MAG: threonine--tRNA ligase [Myxococcota bacterium]